MIDDAELLRLYAEENREDAFAEIVRRHLALVYHAALRQTGGNSHRAEDIAQTVFTDLARKARGVARHPALAGWLHTSTRFAALHILREELRRKVREKEAHVINQDQYDSSNSDDWERLQPVIDEALHTLNERDREVVLLRFFEGWRFADIAAKFSMTEDSARMRVERALDRLRAQLTRRGVTSTSAALAVLLANQASAVAPVGLAATVSGVALSSVAVGGTTGAIVTFMSMSKLQLGIIGAVIATGTTGFVLQQLSSAGLVRELTTLQQENVAAMAVQKRSAPPPPQLGSGVDEKLRAQDAELARLADETAALQREAEKRAAVEREAKNAKPSVVYDPTELDVLPRPTTRTPPQYPIELRKAGKTGEVLVEFVVDEKGIVTDARAVRSTEAGFESVAVEAIKKWTFEAGRKNSLPVNTRMQQPISFTISAESVPTSNWF